MLDLQPTTFEDFLREAKRGNVVPVVRSVLADLQTPVGAFMRVAEGARYSFLLESIEGGERVARYSFLGANPEMVVRGVGRDTLVEKNGKWKMHKGVRATDFARDYFRDRELARRSGLAPLSGGAVGCLAYEAARWFEPVLQRGHSRSHLDLSRTARDQPVAIHVLLPTRRRSHHRRIAGDACALSRPEARLSSDCRNAQTRRDRSRRLALG